VESSRKNLSENIFTTTGIFQNGINLLEGIYQKIFSVKPESFRMESFRKYFQQNWNLSEWNLSEGIFQKIFLTKPESFRMESCTKNLSERNLSERIFQKESWRNNFMTQ
jgi:hypothetical protein